MRPHTPLLRLLPVALLAAGATLVILWLTGGSGKRLQLRTPGSDAAPGTSSLADTNPVFLGELKRGDGQPAAETNAWPQFRGPRRDGKSAGAQLARTWDANGPRQLWAVPVGDGYAGPVVVDGRVFLMDYDVEQRRDALRCLSLQDGRELWRYSYPVNVKRNHGMSRTVPAVADGRVVAIGPKGQVLACDAQSGALLWSRDLGREFGATIPEWYVGQCPLVDGDRVIVAPGGPDALLVALSLATGKELWRTPNPHGWKMTHSSVMPLEFGGRRQLVYCAGKGVVGVAADDGELLWQTTDWKISIATVPSPCVLDEGRIFLSGGYNAGSLLLQLTASNGQFSARTVARFPAEVFGATQHTPVFHDGRLFGTRADGRFTCLTPEGRVVWTSNAGDNLGLGPFLLADGLILALNDAGQLRLLEATPNRHTELARATVLKSARESWGPMALAGRRLLVRDLTRLVCLDVGRD